MTDYHHDGVPGADVSTQVRGHRGRFTGSADTAERDAAACALRVRGRTYSQIAVDLGYANHSGARQAVERALRATVEEPAADVRRLELERLDHMWQAALAVLEHHHIVVSNGRVMWADDTPMVDSAPILAALDRMVRISTRRAELLGLDAPKRSRVEVVTEDAVDAEIRRLEEALGERDTDRRAAGETSTPA